MQFIKSDDPNIGKRELLESLQDKLSRGSVLWLISGGSNIGIEVAIMNSISEELSKNLNILLVDERYGPSGHKDSNYNQLIQAGFDPKNANFKDLLKDQKSPEQALANFKELFVSYKDSSSFIIAELGIGEDGHIAGVLPGSEAVTSDELVGYYQSVPFKRLTLTLMALNSVTEAYVFSFGSSKLTALKNLQTGSKDMNQQPSMILSALDNVKVYNDQI